MRFQKLSPWHYFFIFFEAPLSEEAPGEKVAWLVAREYNSTHLKNKEMISWQISGAALTVWLTRNWNDDQIMAKACESQLLKKVISNNGVVLDAAPPTP